VLPDESRAEYERLLAGLHETLQPEGALEKLLVEKLAIIAWRQRRLLLAESAEIRKNKEFVRWDQQSRERNETEQISDYLSDPLTQLSLTPERGLIKKAHNPVVLQRCVELLSELREQIEDGGFSRERDTILLKNIYGDRTENHLPEDLYDFYETWLYTSEASEGERV